MWQSSKSKSTTVQKKKPRRAGADLQLRRVPVELKVMSEGAPKLGAAPPPILEARVFLSEVSETGLHLFAKEALPAGQPVAVTFETPKRIFLRGHVMSCNEYAFQAQVISTNRFDFRITVEFACEGPEDRKSIQEFCAFLHGGSVAPVAETAPPVEASLAPVATTPVAAVPAVTSEAPAAAMPAEATSEVAKAA